MFLVLKKMRIAYNEYNHLVKQSFFFKVEFTHLNMFEIVGF